MSAALRASMIAIVAAVAVVACTSKSDPRGPACTNDESGCSCTVGAPSGSCAASVVKDALCCASADWPSSGSCSCVAVTCVDAASDCKCGRGLGGPLPSCSGALCCQAADSCYCRRAVSGVPPKCDGADTSQAFCAVPNVRCPAGTKKVDTCS